MAELTVRQAEDQLIELAAVLADKDNIVRLALASGVPKARVSALTGLARSTVDRILARKTESNGS